jgi:hypothetical protein
MKLQLDPRLPESNQHTRPLTQRLYEIFREWANSFNGSFMWSGEDTSIPIAGTWAQGNMVKNSALSEAGSAGSKYVVIGWVCTVSGTPGTWLPMRTLTGN